MNSINKNHKNYKKESKSLRKAQRHGENLQKNSTMYFQVGLIISLLATYFLMDMKFLLHDFEVRTPTSQDDLAEIYNLNNIKIYKEPVKKTEARVDPPKRKKVLITNTIKQVKNNYKITNPTETITQKQNTTDEPFKTNTTPTAPVPSTVNYEFVEEVPVFPGCEGLETNEERKKCMSDKISLLVRRKFDTNVGTGLGLRGVQRFHVQFKINKYGLVTDIFTNAKHKELDREAKRVISKIPKMRPGKQQNKNVSVVYNLPINFQILN